MSVLSLPDPSTVPAGVNLHGCAQASLGYKNTALTPWRRGGEDGGRRAGIARSLKVVGQAARPHEAVGPEQNGHWFREQTCSLP